MSELRKTFDRILKLALAAAIVLTAFVNDPLFESIILLALGVLTIGLTVVGLRVDEKRSAMEKAIDVFIIIIIAAALI